MDDTGDPLEYEVFEKKLKAILISQLEVPAAIVQESGPATPLVGRGIGLDSIEALTLILGLEEEFDIEVEDHELTLDLFSSFGTLIAFVQDRVAEREGLDG